MPAKKLWLLEQLSSLADFSVCLKQGELLLLRDTHRHTGPRN
jgi:hypothetical protein